MRTSRSHSRPGRAWLFLPILALAVTACDSSSDPLAPDDNDHADGERVELLTRGPASVLLAVWIDGEGWQDADGNAITELPNPIDREGENGLQPLRAGGANASLTVRFFGRDGEVIEMGTVSRDPETRSRECTAYNARYRPTDTSTPVLAWPNIQHPDEVDTGPFQFARRATGQLVGIFHCDHIHFYPEQAGSVPVQFRLWHVDHSDMDTDPITVVVEEGELVALRRPSARMTLRPGDDVDTFTGPLGQLVFLRDESGEVREISLRQARVHDLRFHRTEP